MTEKPIIFNGAMVRAICEGRKTQTRRPVKRNCSGRAQLGGRQWHVDDPDAIKASPFGVPGDRLWVRETFGFGTRPDPFEGCRDGIEYRADEAYLDEHDDLPLYPAPSDVDMCEMIERSRGWSPAIHMPRWACRETLIVERVWIERVQDIKHEDALAEGCQGERWVASSPHFAGPHTDDGVLPTEEFHELWDSIYGKRFPSASNPLVWCCEFRREKRG